MEQQQERSYWSSRIECITAISQYALAKKINDCYVGKFVVGTQTFHPRREGDQWTAFVYFKMKA
jgi:hypothetical protein